MSSSPRVSVVIPTYNAEAYVEEAARSILQQTFTDFELIMIDDGSTDSTWAILERLAAQDARIVLQRNSANLGISRTRNLGTDLARGEYIAIMDHDDISLRDRLEKQVAYLDGHPDVGVVGGVTRNLDGAILGAPRLGPMTPNLITWFLHFGVPVAHPASMIRRSVLLAVGGYDPNFRIVNDYDLWFRISGQTGLANLPDVVLHYRRHSGNTTRLQKEAMMDEGPLVVQRVLEVTLGRKVSLDEARQFPHNYVPERHTIADVSGRIYSLAVHFREQGRLSRREWIVVRRDAAWRILRLLWYKPSQRSTFRVLGHAVQLDMVYSILWLGSRLRRGIQSKLVELLRHEYPSR